ncbi:hypothetical protein ACM74Z_28940 [Pseudomonas aeruginosa]|uniref:hypothetical protein n=1 Tax=Pseudomonas TaxID=286 RepID=UPI0003B97BC7|nr:MULTISPECIES: hypothetical protein [Pseudomonas]APC74624.1 hypothetical protein AQ622_04547 [Pseudomonas aeruginosa]EKM6335819.1 hypothetical protein [Pseudomonas aeruginosa]EKQ6315855.1 hypothetical protein [Pseudomonas aeruginosa]EKU2899871.1 hypothetical protein [Pseudomonas aeruginosa]EKW4795832.1 hypothetical protein [Pseudomonas aeruginosa]
MYRVSVFIDWDSAARISPNGLAIRNPDAPLKTKETAISSIFEELQKKTLKKLNEITNNKRATIEKARIYHGWHQGTTATKDRVAWENIRNKIRSLREGNSIFTPEIQFGNELICNGIRVPLYDTLRQDQGGKRKSTKKFQQKMVDTSLISDLLCHCRTESKNFKRDSEPNSAAIIIGDDDDLLPGAFVAEAWGMPTYVFRVSREHESRHISSSGIIHRI